MSSLVSCRMRAAAFCAAIALPALPAQLRAADFGFTDPNVTLPSTQTQPVDFGSGWYIRGDVAYALDTLPEISDWGIFPNTSSWRNTYSLGLGAGYKFTNWFRTDMTLDWRDPLTASDSSTSTYAYGTRWDALFNGYIDLGNWNGFAPYVGAGVGAAWGDAKIYTKDSSLTCTQGGTVTCFEKNDSIHLAWALMAGFAFEIFPHAFVDLGYRYLNLGSYSFYDNSVLSQVGSFVYIPPGSSAAATSRVQEIRLGIRYMID